VFDIALQKAMSDQNVGPVELNKLFSLLRVIGTGSSLGKAVQAIQRGLGDCVHLSKYLDLDGSECRPVERAARIRLLRLCLNEFPATTPQQGFNILNEDWGVTEIVAKNKGFGVEYKRVGKHGNRILS
jgi:hypothetical protein